METTPTLSRRAFLKTTALLGGLALVAGHAPWVVDGLTGRIVPAVAQAQQALGSAYPLNKPENILYSVCLNCHTACNIKAKIQDGLLVKVDGNPYSPMNLLPHLPEAAPLADAARVDAKICPKGQVGVQVAYDPYRVRKVLKRAGKRGENKWQAIEWEQFIDEVVNGGDLFGEGPVEGLKDIYKLRDPDLSKVLAADAAAVAAGDMTVEAFKQKHADHLDLLIDPDHPDLGPVNNQFVFMGGRMEHGRKELGKRFTYDGFGSVNFYLHTTICEQSHHIAYEMMSGKTHMKPDFQHSEFVIFFGTGAFEANFGPTPMTEMVTDSLVRRNFKYAVVDPRLSKTAAKAWRWIPIKPGADGALAMGMIRWIIENGRYDEAYLRAPNKEAANAIDETNFTDATHLVRTDEMVFLKPEDAGLESPEGGARVVMVDGTPTLSTEAMQADLFVDSVVNGIPVKSVMQLLKERAQEMTLEEYAEWSGVPLKNIVELAQEFTSHGKRAAAEFYRGPVQHTNGYYNGQAIITLNVLIGNADWKGGLTTGGGHWHEDGSKPGAPFPKAVIVNAPGGLTKFGIHVNREGTAYEQTTLFEGYPAKRPWYPFTYELYQNIIPSAAAGYPYPIKALFIIKGTPILASPAGHAQIEMLRDPTKIPLVISCDVVIGETSMYADYILPDLTYLERWGTPHITPAIVTKVSKVRQPLIAPLTETVVVDGEEMPISMEAFLIAVGKKLGLAGFGKDALGPGYDFNRLEDYYLAMCANLAFGDQEDGSEKLPAADEEEMRIFREARRHLPKSVFDEEKWKQAIPEELWPSVVYLLNRGGRYEPATKAYQGNKLAHQWKGQWNLYVEKVAKGYHSMTGERFSGLPVVEPVKDAAGNVVDDGPDYDLTLITYKEIVGGQSRTHGAYWIQYAVLPENYVYMNRRDAEARGLKDGDMVRIVSASLPDARFDLGDGRTYEVKAKVRTVEGMRPGTIAISWSYGHWAYGSNDVEIDGEVIPGDPRRASGTVPNPSMRVDPVLNDVCLTDPIGGSASFYDTRVRVQKV
ncbi:molybdopterin-dependent oxidoreductase [Litorilinea aerophila]|uniref:Molybdopterin-dependent oxidoreductase n=1 Tax=Litorilinea aerophila TaxID=1204385 RepID=A0A540VLR9_9CHLR|nr:molybdopterin-dependent oxidoreductase [Litorilinea aerophila]MCC9074945.1 molybdopterin-dependent oxidoreductase [Litorilinea aerophila]